ncbi:F-box domain-containing protein [Psidium guajava]|nr:F-box domain-containing protein [Psidium guajava]
MLVLHPLWGATWGVGPLTGMCGLVEPHCTIAQSGTGLVFLTYCLYACTAHVPVYLCVCVYMLGSHGHSWADGVMYALVFRLMPVQFRRDVHPVRRNSPSLRVQYIIHQARIIRKKVRYVGYVVNN